MRGVMRGNFVPARSSHEDQDLNVPQEYAPANPSSGVRERKKAPWRTLASRNNGCACSRS